MQSLFNFGFMVSCYSSIGCYLLCMKDDILLKQHLSFVISSLQLVYVFLPSVCSVSNVVFPQGLTTFLK